MSEEPCPITRDQTEVTLDEVARSLLTGHTEDGMGRLSACLSRCRAEWQREVWQRFCKEEWPQHSVRYLVHQDPFTLRSYQKPLGYPGDAVLLDMVYGYGWPPQGISELGLRIGNYTLAVPETTAVRRRYRIMADRINRTAESLRGEANVLSVGCGHLREAAISAAVIAGNLNRLYALDHDAAALEEVRGRGPYDIVVPVHGSVRSLVTGQTVFADLDLIYASGLYDYLPRRMAGKLTAVLFAMLRPGGKLVITDFGPGPPSVGYMECCMDWWLIYRSEEDMQALLDEAIEKHVADLRTYRDPTGVVVFLEMTRS